MSKIEYFLQNACSETTGLPIYLLAWESSIDERKDHYPKYGYVCGSRIDFDSQITKLFTSILLEYLVQELEKLPQGGVFIQEFSEWDYVFALVRLL